MTRFLVGLIVFALAACSSPDVVTPATDQEPGEDAVNPTGPETTIEGTDSVPSGRPAAPDFTLELGDGGTYTLSEGEKPVYLVFWAEW